MAFDIATAQAVQPEQPAQKKAKFDIESAKPIQTKQISVFNPANDTYSDTDLIDANKVSYMSDTQVANKKREQFFGMQEIDDNFVQDYIGKESGFFTDLSRGVANEVIRMGQDIKRFGTKISARSIIASQIGIRKLKGEDVTGEMTEWNKLISQELVELSKTNEKYRQSLGIAKTEYDGITFDIGSVFAQLGMSVVSRSPTVMASVFGITQQQQLSEEIFQTTGEVGRAEGVALGVAIPTAALEYVGIDRFLKAIKGNNIIGSIITSAATESIQEGLQGVVEEVGTQAFGGREKDLVDTIKGIGYEMILGGIAGGGISGMASIGKTRIQEKGIDKKIADNVSQSLAQKINDNTDLHKETADIINRQNDNTTNYGNNVESGIAEVKKAIDEITKTREEEAVKNKTGDKSLIDTLIEDARGDNLNFGQKDLINILDTYDTAIKELKKTQPKSLIQFIRENGGIFDEGGELKAMDIQLSSPFVLRNSTINNQGIDVTPDSVALRAWEAGYFSEFDTRPNVKDLLNAIDNELRGNKVISSQDIGYQIERENNEKIIDQIEGSNIDLHKIRLIRDIINEREKSDRLSVENELQKELKETTLEKGVIAKGKYDYKTNKIFDEIRRINKLTQKDAISESGEFSENPEELSEAENIIMRFTALKATGINKASTALRNQVLEDIKKLKEVGKKARDQKDFEDLVEKFNDIDEAFELIDKSKADSDSKKTKVLSSLLSVTGNFESYLNVLGGKKLTDKFSVLENQKEEFNSVKKATDKIVEDISSITDNKKNKTLNLITNMGVKNFDLIAQDTSGKPIKISTFDVIDIYNAIKNENIKEDYYRVYGKNQIDSIVSNLSDEQVKIADSLNDTVKSYYDKINAVFVKLYNRDLPFVKNYWMSSTENQSVSEIFSSYQLQSKNPSFIKRRQRTRRPIPKNAFNKTMAFIQKAEYFDNVGLKYREIERTFKDTKVKKVIIDKRGEKFYNAFIKQLDHFSLNSLNENITSIENTYDKTLGNWVTAKIGLNPTVAIKQLSSVVNYAENMPTAKWISGFTKGLVSPKQTFDFVWNNSEYIRNRYNNGYSEALQSAMNSANNMPKAKGKLDKFQNFLTSFTRMGDIGAIVYGGKPYIDYLQKQGMSLKDAINEFENVTLRSQQSPFSSTRSVLQNKKSPFVRSLLAFSNTPNQYARKFIESKAQYTRGEISLAELGKIYTIYGIVNPSIYIWLGQVLGSLIYGRKIDEEKATKEMLIMMAESPIAGIPILNDFVDASLRGLSGLRVYENQTPALSDIINLGADLGTGEWIEAMKTFGELTTGAPVKTATKIAKNIEKNL